MRASSTWARTHGGREGAALGVWAALESPSPVQRRVTQYPKYPEYLLRRASVFTVSLTLIIYPDRHRSKCRQRSGRVSRA